MLTVGCIGSWKHVIRVLAPNPNLRIVIRYDLFGVQAGSRLQTPRRLELSNEHSRLPDVRWRDTWFKRGLVWRIRCSGSWASLPGGFEVVWAQQSQVARAHSQCGLIDATNWPSFFFSTADDPFEEVPTPFAHAMGTAVMVAVVQRALGKASL